MIRNPFDHYLAMCELKIGWTKDYHRKIAYPESYDEYLPSAFCDKYKDETKDMEQHEANVYYCNNMVHDVDKNELGGWDWPKSQFRRDDKNHWHKCEDYMEDHKLQWPPSVGSSHYGTRSGP